MASNENIVAVALINDVIKDLNSIIDVLTTTVQCEVETVESVVNNVMEELLILVCKSPSEDEPPESLLAVDISGKRTSVAVEDGPQGDAPISVNHVDVLPAKGVKLSKCFCELSGLLDPGVTPQQRAPHRRRGFFTALWRCVKRVVCGVCCLRCG